MKELIDYLLQYGKLNGQQIELIKASGKEVSLKGEEYFSEAGKTAKHLAFIVEGVFRVCYFDSNGADVTRYFISEGHFVVDLVSFENKIPSVEYVQAVTNCKTIVFSYETWKELSQTIIVWDDIVNKITSKTLIGIIERISPMMAVDAKTRYLNFLEKFPNLANRVPLSMLASYLGITPSSLSRIRKNI